MVAGSEECLVDGFRYVVGRSVRGETPRGGKFGQIEFVTTAFVDEAWFPKCCTLRNLILHYCDSSNISGLRGQRISN